MSNEHNTIKKWVMGNWKLNPASLTEALALTKSIVNKQANLQSQLVNIAVAPTFLHLQSVKQSLANNISLMAQDVSTHADNGAYTGDVNAALLKDIGVSHCLVGHSERRQYQQETNEQLTQKINNAIEHSIQTVYCVGEPLAVRDSEEHLSFVTEQLLSVLKPIASDINSDNLIIAYEPVWAIGTGKVASVDNIIEMHAHIRTILTELNADLSTTSLLYGGSVKPNNATEIAGCSNVDGALVGGASLDSEQFLDIVSAFS